MMHSALSLAAADWDLAVKVAMFAIASVNLVANLIIVPIVLRLRQLESEVKAAAKREVEQRFEAFESRCSVKHGALAREVEAVQERLGRGDNTFEKLGEARHEVERDLILAIGDLKETMLRECARREDVEALKAEFGRLAGRVDGMAETRARKA